MIRCKRCVRTYLFIVENKIYRMQIGWVYAILIMDLLIKLLKKGNTMYYDITNPDASYYWLHELLQMQSGEFIEEYIINCHNDFEEFFEKYSSVINNIDIENLELVAFHVTSNSNQCEDIKKYGLHNLQWVLSNDTDLNRFLKENNVKFDIKSKVMYIGDVAYDIDYEKYKNLDVISKRNEKLHNIGHKIYYDFQINAFLFCEDIYNYSTIHEVPEFIFSLSSLNDKTNELYIKWKSMCEPYVVKYKAKIKDFTYFTFYDSEMEYENDRQDNWKRLRKLLISRSIESMFSRSSSEIYAYMAPDTVVSGENIIEYIPAEEWRKNVLKYFGKK